MTLKKVFLNIGLLTFRKPIQSRYTINKYKFDEYLDIEGVFVPQNYADYITSVMRHINNLRDFIVEFYPYHENMNE